MYLPVFPTIPLSIAALREKARKGISDAVSASLSRQSYLFQR